MAYLNCPNCGLSFRVQGLDVVIEKCPRCLARAGQVTRLLLSELPHRPLPAPAERETVEQA